jgi:nicotinate phosphoribosyltransferase
MIEHGPYKQEITNNLDFYKATMSQLAYETAPEAVVQFKLTNRNADNLAEAVNVSELQDRLNCIQEKNFSDDEIKYLASLDNSTAPMFNADYLNYLKNGQLPKVNVEYDHSTNDLSVKTTGRWPMVSFWETVVMSEINELYFERLAREQNIDVMDLYDIGLKKLNAKIQTLKQNPGIKIADFGTRRRFSYRWHKFVVETLAQELPEQFMGSSNIGLSKIIGKKPIGTFAHEMPMVYAALAEQNGQDIKQSHGKMLDDWYEKYGQNLSIALTDTFGSDFFFNDFNYDRAKNWNGLRQDSGDPIQFGEQAVKYYQTQNIDPMSKIIVFSDGLTIDDIVNINNHFKGQIKTAYGWGTSLTNDLGLPALNIVMKAVKVNNTETVKLSDSPGKHTGSSENVKRYQNVFA